jgi:hypothetical protein
MTGDAAKQNKGDLSRARTLLYVIGAQKAGTTWFHHQFGSHPRIHFARKEFHYWNARRSPGVNYRAVPVQPLLGMIGKLRGGLGDALMRVDSRLGDGVLAWRMVLAPPEDHSHYREGLLRRMPADATIVGDITPNYALLSASTFAEMAALHPDPRFIFVMRDPVDRLWSGVRHRLRRWFDRPGVDPALAARWFETALEDEFNDDLRSSRYDATIRRLDAAGVSDRVLFLFYETLFSDATLRRIRAFLEIEPHVVDAGEMVLETAKWPVEPSPEVRARAVEVFRPTYDFVRARFGNEVPELWRDPSVSLAQPVPA